MEPRVSPLAGVLMQNGPAPSDTTIRLRAVAARAMQVALLGSLTAGFLETAAGVVYVSRDLLDEAIPLRLCVAAFGQSSLSHLLIVGPVFVGLSVIASYLTRGGFMSGRASLVASYAILAGVVVVLGDIVVHRRSGPLIVTAAFVGVGLAAAVLYVVLRIATRRLQPLLRRRISRVLTAVGLLMLVGAGVVFWLSPLYDSADFHAGPPAQESAGGHGPHVLWIVIDTARGDSLEAKIDGRPVMPFLREFARQSLYSKLAIGDGMWTVPSHASMFTGFAPRRHGAGHDHLRLEDDFRTIAEILADAGYATALVSSNPFVGASTNLAQGFQHVRMTHFLRRMERFSLDFLHESLGLSPVLPWFDGDYGAALSVDLVGRWLDANPDRPRFLFVNLMEAHAPYRVPLRYRRMFMSDRQVGRSYALRYRAYGNIVRRLVVDYNIRGPQVIAPDDREILRRQYAAGLRYLDDRIAELIGMFADRGLLDQTLVVIASDHGEYLGGHGMWEHRYLTYQDLAHVVTILNPPGDPSPRTINRPTQLSDLFATVHAFAGPQAPQPVRLNARDLFASNKAATEPRFAVCEFAGPARDDLRWIRRRNDPELQHRAAPQVAVVGPRYKLMVSESGRRELYDLLTDPAEKVNLLEQLPQEAERLAEALAGWRERTAAYEPSGDAIEDLSPETLRSLRSLGYLGGEEGKNAPPSN